MITEREFKILLRSGLVSFVNHFQESDIIWCRKDHLIWKVLPKCFEISFSRSCWENSLTREGYKFAKRKWQGYKNDKRKFTFQANELSFEKHQKTATRIQNCFSFRFRSAWQYTFSTNGLVLGFFDISLACIVWNFWPQIHIQSHSTKLINASKNNVIWTKETIRS